MMEYDTILFFTVTFFLATFFYRFDYNDDAEFSGLRWEHTIVGYLSMPTYDSALQHAKSIFYPGPPFLSHFDAPDDILSQGSITIV